MNIIEQTQEHIMSTYGRSAVVLKQGSGAVCEDAEQKRYIEVKSTASFKPILFNSVHLTPNEWRVAETERDRYFVYRLFLCISTGAVKLYMLQDPVGKYKADEITMMPSSAGGVDVRFDSKKVGQFEELLKWNG